MPPEGNTQLTIQEIQLIKLWIESGSDFENVTLMDNLSIENKNSVLSFFPPTQKNVSPPSLNDLKKLDLSNSNLNDKLFFRLSKLENLKYLKVNNTSIIDISLKHLPKLLETLIINGNNISNNGLIFLEENKSLKNIYAWNTKIDDKKINKEKLLATIHLGVKDFSKGVPLSEPITVSEQTMFSDSLKIEFYNPLGNPTIRYTLNGEDPDTLSTIYTKPFLISSSLNLKAIAFKKGWLDSKISSVDFVKVEGILENYILKTSPDNRYKNPKKLFDGVVGDINFRDGDWNGFIRSQDYVIGVNERNSGDLIVEIDLKEKQYSAIGIHALESIGAYIMFPKSVELYDISQKKEKLIYSKNFIASKLGAPNLTKLYKVPITNKSSKLKLVVKSNKQLPKGHPAAGEYAWLFVDEILLL
jgi:hypothetical protein